MGKYLTATQFLLAEDSVPGLASIPRTILNRTILRAESLIDAYVGFDARLGGFEPHTAWFQDAFDERTLRIRIPNYPVPARIVDRYRIQVSNLSSNGSGFFANINTGDCAINTFSGYVEIVPLQAVTYSMTPFMMGLGLKPPLVQIDYEAGFYIATFGEVLENTLNDNTTYRAQNGFWATVYNIALHLQPNTLPPIPPIIYVNDIVQLSSTYTLDITEGTVTFNVPQAANAVVKADYTYQIPTAVRDATVAQVTNMLHQRRLNLMGLGGLEVARSRDQQIKRHIRTSADTSTKDEPALDPLAMQLLEPYTYIPAA